MNRVTAEERCSIVTSDYPLEGPIDLLSTPARTAPLAVIDLEMTGLDTQVDRVCEIAVLRVEGGEVVSRFQSLIRPPVRVRPSARKVHGITDAMLAEAPPFAAVEAQLRALLDGAVVVSHNVGFDLGYLLREFAELGVEWAHPVTLDTLTIARRLFRFSRNNLATVAAELDLTVGDAHRAMADAQMTLAVFQEMMGRLDPQGTVTVAEVEGLVGALEPNSPLRLRQQHLLREGLRERRTVWLDYQGAPGASLTTREVAIWRIALPRVQGWCYLRQGERVFRQDRMIAVRRGAKHYEIPPFDSKIS